VKKIKLWHWLLIIFGSVFSILAFFIIVPVIILDKSWWWFFGPLIFFLVAGLIVGLILLITRMKKKPPVKIKIDLKDAKKRAVYEIQTEEDNPDNFQILKSKLIRIGEKGLEKTPILVLEGVGTEKNEKRVVIINLNNPKHEMTKLINPSEEEKMLAIRLIAEHPPEEAIKEEITQGMGQFGMPQTSIKRTIPSQAEQKEKEEKEKAESANAM